MFKYFYLIFFFSSSLFLYSCAEEKKTPDQFIHKIEKCPPDGIKCKNCIMGGNAWNSSKSECSLHPGLIFEDPAKWKDR